MRALQNLTDATVRLTAAVDRVANGVGQPTGVPEADVDAAATAVTEQAQRLEALPTPTDGNGDGAGATTARHK